MRSLRSWGFKVALRNAYQCASKRSNLTISFIRLRSSASQFLVPNNSSTILRLTVRIVLKTLKRSDLSTLKPNLTEVCENWVILDETCCENSEQSECEDSTNQSEEHLACVLLFLSCMSWLASVFVCWHKSMVLNSLQYIQECRCEKVNLRWRPLLP